jgi:splicing factor 3B subunit 1
LAEHRRPTIADRENEYQKKRRMVQGAISPERVDYFADGKYTNKFFNSFIFFTA